MTVTPLLGDDVGLADITNAEAIEKAIAEFDELGQPAFLEKYGFKPSRSLLIDFAGKLYDSKAILGAAHGYQFEADGPLHWDQFSGGEETTKRKLTDLGFTVVRRIPLDELQGSEEPPPLGEVIRQVLALQRFYSKDNTPEMQERGVLVRKVAPKALAGFLPPDGVLPFEPSIEGRDAAGLKARVPWVRVFSKTHSPSAMKGWYVALLFAADGSGAFLTLASGTSHMVDGSFKLRSPEWLQDRVAWARQVLGTIDDPAMVASINLGESNGLGRQYELGTVVGYRLPADGDLDEDTFAVRLQHLLALLGQLYVLAGSEDELATEEVAEGSQHLLLKWNPAEDPETMEKHLRTAAEHGGMVWWGNFTKGDKRMQDRRVELFRRQLEGDSPTWAYLYRLGPKPAVWRARVRGVSNRREDIDEVLLPSYYGPDQRHNAYVLLEDIEPFDLDWLLENVALAKNPIAGSLAPALRNQTSPMNVVHLGAGATEVAPTASALSREWLREQTMWPEADLDELLSALLGPSPQVLLAGPPGTGKSWVAQAIARYLTGDRHGLWRLVQFHPSYGYESFIEGVRPVANEGAISFERVDGTVLRLARAARLSDQPHVLIMDELNRANVPRVLGELMFLFEYRDETIDLQHSQGFALPRNLGFIGTMNTADRSIRSIDVALRRRFEIFECLPDADMLESFYDLDKGINFVPDLVPGFVALNAALEEELDRHHTIGQSFFMAGEMTADRLRRVWSRKIFPLIEEYFFDAPDLASQFEAARFWPSMDA